MIKLERIEENIFFDYVFYWMALIIQDYLKFRGKVTTYMINGNNWAHKFETSNTRILCHDEVSFRKKTINK